MHRSQTDAFLILIFGLLVSEDSFRVEWKRAIKLEHSTILVEAARKTRTVWLRSATVPFHKLCFKFVSYSEPWLYLFVVEKAGVIFSKNSWQAESVTIQGLLPLVHPPPCSSLVSLSSRWLYGGPQKEHSALVLWIPCCADHQWFDLPMFPLSLLQQSEFSASL